MNIVDEEEVRLIKAYRAGAKVDVWFHNMENKKEIYKLLNRLGLGGNGYQLNENHSGRYYDITPLKRPYNVPHYYAFTKGLE